MELEANPIMPLPLPVLSGHLLRQIVLTEPLKILRFLPATMAVNEISLVQITAPFPSLGNFLYDTSRWYSFGHVFRGKYRTFPGHLRRKSVFRCTRYHPS